ncbi:antitoxin MazE family protein [Lichenicoccus sp.]|uniref:antitoxin MazE family protein n=1 Tax=Lichenicoccus sp. TaxID=2781899 RepID=UPI003D0A5D5F
MGQQSNSRARRHRDGLRARGLRPIQIWVPDSRAPGFAAEAHRQSQNAAAADEQDAIMDWIEEVSWLDDDAG